MKSYRKVSTIAKFKLAHQLSEAGVATRVIAEAVERTPGTIRVWLKFDKYEDFAEFVRKSHEKYGKKTVADIEQTKMEEVLPDLPPVDHSATAILIEIRNELLSLLELEQRKYDERKAYLERKQGFFGAFNK